MENVKSREEIEEKYKWKLESIYGSDQEWEGEFEEVKELLPQAEKFEGRVTESGETLLEVLQLREKAFREVDKLFAYARMKSDQDTRDQTYQAMSSRARGLHSKAESVFSFIEPEIQASSREEVEELISGTPGLETYGHYFDDVLRLKPHTRSSEIESLVADLQEVLGAPGEIYNYLTNADLQFPEVKEPDGSEAEITLSNFVNLLRREDRDFRREVYEKFYDSFEDLSNTLAVSYENSVKTDNKLARIKNYDSARERSLDQNKVPIEVYENLLNVVEENLELLHRHLELKREALGTDQLEMWDLYVPLAESESPEITYREAKDHVLGAVEPLGEEYRDRLERGFRSRWVDVYENPGKRAGAYSGGSYDTQPFILMNYKGDISSLYTLAHESGHSMHSKLASENQPYVYGDYSIFLAEVASTLHEGLLTEYLLEGIEDPDFRLHLLDHFLETFRTVLYRQTMFARFEQEVHERAEDGQALTFDSLCELFGEVKGDYYRPAAVDERIKREWMRIPHFYRSYYVYQYSTGISASLALTGRIMEEGDSAVEDYLEMLKSGSSQYPLEVLRKAGVDMTEPEPLNSALSLYDKYLSELEELL